MMSAIPDPASAFAPEYSKGASSNNASDGRDPVSGRNAIDGRDPKTGQFLKGVKGVGGRKKGSRAKLSEEFFAALHADFLEHGPQTIAQVRFRHPGIYLQVVAKLMPQKIEITNPLDEISDELLSIMLEQAEQIAASKMGLLGDDAKPVTVIDAHPAPLPAPAVTIEALTVPPSRSPSRDAAAAARRADLEDQAAAVQRHEPVLPSQSLPYPVGRAVPPSEREAERRNVAKLHDDGDEIDPASLF